MATHRDQRFDSKRVFELFPDRINIRGSKMFSSEFETSIPLNSLNPNPAHIRFRNKSFWSGLWMLLVASILDTILVSAFHIPRVSESTGLIAVLGMSGLALMVATARKVEFISFSTTAGVHVLDFARSGRDAHGLDSFIELVTSTETLNEAGSGDSEMARERLDLLRGIRVIPVTENAADLARKLIASGLVPEIATPDAVHIALASVYEIDFLVTWNFKHIANPHIGERLRKKIIDSGYRMPVMCSPEELLTEDDNL